MTAVLPFRLKAAAETQVSSQLAAIDRIDRQTDAAKTAVTQAQAAIASAQADLDLAAADLKRAQRLKQSDFVSAQALEQANATQEKAQASVETAKALLNTKSPPERSRRNASSRKNG